MKIIYKNPYLYIVYLTPQFYYVSNLSRPNSGRIINHKQYNLLNLIDGYKTTQDIAQILGENTESIVQALDILVEDHLIDYDNSFILPQPAPLESLSLWVHTTDNCNLRCDYCYIATLGENRVMQNPQIEQLCNKIIETVNEHSLKKVVLRLSGGECFLYLKQWEHHLLALKKAIDRLGCGLNIAAITNLTLLDAELLRIIKDLNISISCSLDGLGQYNDISRHYLDGRGSYCDVTKNIQVLLANNIKPSVLIVVNNSNTHGLLELTKNLIKLEIPFRYSIVNSKDIDYIAIREALQQCYTYMYEQISHGFHFIENHRLDNIKINGINFNFCGAGINSSAIYIDGDVYFCQTDFGIRAAIGSIYDKATLSQMSSSFSSTVNNINSSYLGCKSCIFRYKCAGGCPLREDKKELCNIHKEFIPVLMRLAGMQRLNQLLKAYGGESAL